MSEQTTSPVSSPISVDWLAEHLDDPGLVVLDATTHLPIPKEGPYVPESGRATFDAEHIPGAHFAELLTDFADTEAPGPWTVPSSEVFAAAAGALGIGPGVTVVIYDQHSGFWATRLWWHLRLEGFDDVAVLDGGLTAWKAAGHPVTDRPSPAPRPAEFVARRRPELLQVKHVLEKLCGGRHFEQVHGNSSRFASTQAVHPFAIRPDFHIVSVLGVGDANPLLCHRRPIP